MQFIAYSTCAVYVTYEDRICIITIARERGLVLSKIDAFHVKWYIINTKLIVIILS